MKKKPRLSRSGRKICLILVNPVYKKVTEIVRTPDGKLVKERKDKLQKETRVIKWVDRDAIISVEEYITRKGDIAKKRSIVYDKYTNRFYATWHTVNEILEVLEDRKEHTVGFKSNHSH